MRDYFTSLNKVFSTILDELEKQSSMRPAISRKKRHSSGPQSEQLLLLSKDEVLQGLEERD